MDGVLADFVVGVCAAHNRPDPYLDRSSYGIFDMEKLWGISAEEFWAKTCHAGFWENLPKTPEADGIVETACSLFGEKNVAILTAPSNDWRCIPEKKAWVKKYYPHLASSMLFGSAKRFLAGPKRLLVDDRDKNVENFRGAGGSSVTVPRKWNKLYPFAHQCEDITKEDMHDYAMRWMEAAVCE